MDDRCSISGARIGILGVIAIVLLRMTIGAHFFSEGTKKLSPDFSSAGFLQSAKGPLAPYYKSFAAPFHHWDELLATPRKSPEYVGYSQETDKPPVPESAAEPQNVAIRLSHDDPAGVWGNRVLHDWEEMLVEFQQTPGLSEKQQEQAEAVFTNRAQKVKEYLTEISDEVSDFRHELWRKAQWEAQATAGELPFLDSRIAGKEAEVRGAPWQWVASVEAMEAAFVRDLRDVLNEEQHDSALAMKHVESTLSPKSWLSFVDRSVTFLTIGAGLSLLFGFFTRLGALAAAAFLLSVMATQPPWVPGADLSWIWYQAVEFTALLALAAIGAGRWASLDAIIRTLWSGCCRKKESTPPKPA